MVNPTNDAHSWALTLLGTPGCEWLGLLCFQACWKWLSLALQEVSDWACFVFKPAENDCPWLFRGWVTELALFSSLLKMIVLGSPGGEWLGLLCFQACWKWLSLALQKVSDWACFVFKLAENECPWLSSWWVTGLALFSCWKWLSLALQNVSDWACFVFKPADNTYLFLSLQIVSGHLHPNIFSLQTNYCLGFSGCR